MVTVRRNHYSVRVPLVGRLAAWFARFARSSFDGRRQVMAMRTAATVTSLDGFHTTSATTSAAQRADKLVRAYFDAVNVDGPARTDAVVAPSLPSYDTHATRSRTGLKRSTPTFGGPSRGFASKCTSTGRRSIGSGFNQSIGLLSDEVRDG